MPRFIYSIRKKVVECRNVWQTKDSHRKLLDFQTFE